MILTIDEYLALIDKKMKEKSGRYKTKSGWRTVGDKKHFFRSKWEANYACYLEFLKEQRLIKDWFFEPKTFWFNEIKRGTRSYLPDFLVIDNRGSHKWIEVKGYMDSKSKTKIKRFAKYYPEEKLEIIGKEWFKANEGEIKNIVTGWE